MKFDPDPLKENIRAHFFGQLELAKKICLEEGNCVPFLKVWAKTEKYMNKNLPKEIQELISGGAMSKEEATVFVDDMLKIKKEIQRAAIKMFMIFGGDSDYYLEKDHETLKSRWVKLFNIF
jgi:hypothetical protein